MRTKIFSGDWRMSSPYGWRTLDGKKQFHNGVDFSMVSTTKLLVPDTFNNSVVRLAQKDKFGGKYIQLKRPDGKGCYYLHVSAFKKKVGDKVKTGDVIALSGNTGHSSGPHTHFGVQKRATLWGSHEDPMKYITLDNKSMYKKGDRVEFTNTVGLSVRISHSTSSGLALKIDGKTKVVAKVMSTPVSNDGYTWYFFEGLDFAGWVVDKWSKKTTRARTDRYGKIPQGDCSECEQELSDVREALRASQEVVKDLEWYKEYFDALDQLLETVNR